MDDVEGVAGEVDEPHGEPRREAGHSARISTRRRIWVKRVAWSCVPGRPDTRFEHSEADDEDGDEDDLARDEGDHRLDPLPHQPK